MSDQHYILMPWEEFCEQHCGFAGGQTVTGCDHDDFQGTARPSYESCPLRYSHSGDELVKAAREVVKGLVCRDYYGEDITPIEVDALADALAAALPKEEG